MHAFSPPQLASLLYSLAAYREPWHPGDLWLFDFQTNTGRRMGSWGPGEAAHVLWAFARLRWV